MVREEEGPSGRGPRRPAGARAAAQRHCLEEGEHGQVGTSAGGGDHDMRSAVTASTRSALPRLRPGGGRGRNGREVDGGDPPAAFREPDRVAPFAGGQVQRPPGCRLRGLPGDHRVGGCRPDEVTGVVAAVPSGGVHGTDCGNLPAPRGADLRCYRLVTVCCPRFGGCAPVASGASVVLSPMGTTAGRGGALPRTCRRATTEERARTSVGR